MKTTHYRVPPGLTQNVAFDATAGAIATGVGTQTRKVQIMVTVDAFVRIDKTPTAVITTDMPLPAALPMTYDINPGEKVSAVSSAAAGTLYVTELI